MPDRFLIARMGHPEENPYRKDLTGEDGGTIVESVERSAALPINRTE